MTSYPCTPDTSQKEFEEALKDLNEELRKLNAHSKNIFIFGDFNLSTINWKNGRGLDKFQFLEEFIEEWNLEQMVNEPTRKDNILDLLFTNSNDIIETIEVDRTVEQVLNYSYHSIVLMGKFQGKMIEIQKKAKFHQFH